MTEKTAAADWLDSYDWDEFEDVEGSSSRWFYGAQQKLNVNSRSECRVSYNTCTKGWTARNLSASIPC
jgi:hypothetical protein